MSPPIILVELNRTLAIAPPGQSGGIPGYDVEGERYIPWLLDLLRTQAGTVYVVTARPVALAARTCAHLALAAGGWRPSGVFFNDRGLLGSAWKKKILAERLRPRHGNAPIIAIDNHADAARMYARNRIMTYTCDHASAWPSLPA